MFPPLGDNEGFKTGPREIQLVIEVKFPDQAANQRSAMRLTKWHKVRRVELNYRAALCVGTHYYCSARRDTVGRNGLIAYFLPQRIKVTAPLEFIHINSLLVFYFAPNFSSHVISLFLLLARP